YESSILDVAHTESIDLDAKLSLAAGEAGDKILRFLLQYVRREDEIPRRMLGVSDVVVTTPLRRWHAFQTLQNVYRDAYGSQENARYLEKMRAYGQAALTAADEYFETGVGLVYRPVA